MFCTFVPLFPSSSSLLSSLAFPSVTRQHVTLTVTYSRWPPTPQVTSSRSARERHGLIAGGNQVYYTRLGPTFFAFNKLNVTGRKERKDTIETFIE